MVRISQAERRGGEMRPGPKVRPITERFWGKVDIREPGECWPWKGGIGKGGYGRFTLPGHFGKMVQAHRMADELANGPIPNGLFVCHKCDNPPCCNPSHLFRGTHAENLADMTQKGRRVSIPSRASGERNGGSKLSDMDVRCVRRLRDIGLSQRAIGLRMGISQSQVGRIVRAEQWRG
jgi:hypothetical protein